MSIYLSLLVAVIGALVYAFANGKIADIGRMSFFAGLLAFLLTYSKTFSL